MPAASAERAVESLRLLNATLGVVRTMAFAHSQGVLHRDLKPDNIVLGEYGETVVLDWGLAKVRGAAAGKDDDAGPSPPLPAPADVTQQGSVMGTPVYMSPEQASGRVEDVDERTDVYGLGVMLYELLTGRRPFTARTGSEMLRQVIEADPPRPRSVAPGVPKPLEAICLKAMAKRRADRYPSADALAEDIERHLANLPTSAYRESVWERAGRWLRKHKTLALAAAAALVLVAAVAVVAAVLVGQQRDRAETARAEAVRQEELTRQALARAEDSMYATRVALAQREWQDGYLDKAARALATCPEDRRGWEWRYLNRVCRTYRLHLGATGPAITSIAYSPDGRRIATGHEDGKVRLWGAESGQLLATCAAHAAPVRQVLFRPEGGRLISLGGETLCAWDLTSGRAAWRKEKCYFEGPMALSPDGKILAYPTDKLQQCRGDSGQPLPGPGVIPADIETYDLRALAFSPDPTWFVSSWGSLQATATGRRLGSAVPVEEQHGPIAVSPDGNSIVAVTERHSMIWYAHRPRAAATRQGAEWPVGGVEPERLPPKPPGFLNRVRRWLRHGPF